MMTTSLSLAPTTRPFDFGTQKPVNSSWLHSKGIQTRSIQSRSLTMRNPSFRYQTTTPFASGPLNKYNNRTTQIIQHLTTMDGSMGRTASYCSGSLRAIASASIDRTTPESLVRMLHSSTLEMCDGAKIGLNVIHHRIMLICHTMFTGFFLCMYAVSPFFFIPHFSIASHLSYHIL